MGLFRRKEKTVDLTERYFRQKDRMQNLKEGMKQSSGTEDSSQSSSGNFNFLANLASSSQSSSAYPSQESEDNSEDKRRKLAKRLMDITEKIEEISTQIYHLQQRVELLERKNKTGFE